MYHKRFNLIVQNRCHKAEASLTRLHPIIDMSLDDNLQGYNWKQFKGRCLTSLGRLTSVSLRQCKESNTLQNEAHNMCTPQMKFTRSLDHYAWGCICGILSPEDTWGYGNDPSNLRLSDAVANNIGSAIKHQRDKWTLRTHITAKNTVTQYSLPGFWRFLLGHLNIFLVKSNIAKTSRNAQYCA